MELHLVFLCAFGLSRHHVIHQVIDGLFGFDHHFFSLFGYSLVCLFILHHVADARHGHGAADEHACCKFVHVYPSFSLAFSMDKKQAFIRSVIF